MASPFDTPAKRTVPVFVVTPETERVFAPISITEALVRLPATEFDPEAFFCPSPDKLKLLYETPTIDCVDPPL